MSRTWCERAAVPVTTSSENSRFGLPGTNGEAWNSRVRLPWAQTPGLLRAGVASGRPLGPSELPFSDL